MEIDGTAAIVTGGASGLGEATARLLAAEGAAVTILDLNDERGGQVAGEIGGRYVRTDVSDEAATAAAVETAAGGGAPLRIAVNCAGIGTASRVVDRDGNPHPYHVFVKTITVNLVGTFNVMRLAAAAMAATEPANADGERGVVVNTASIAAFDGQIGQLAYSASKGGVVGMCLPAARDLASKGIRVCTIAPGTFDTPMFRLAPQKVQDALAESVPFPKRAGDPTEYAAMVRAIVQIPELNGETIRLDGAIRMPPR